MTTAWCTARVISKTPGATYEEIIYDQYLDVTIEGQAITLFDMSPILAADAGPGMDAEVIIAVEPIGLTSGPGGGQQAELVAAPASLELNATEVRPEALRPGWVLLRAGQIRVLLPARRLEELGRASAVGAVVSWKDATYYLYGWRGRR